MYNLFIEILKLTRSKNFLLFLTMSINAAELIIQMSALIGLKKLLQKNILNITITNFLIITKKFGPGSFGKVYRANRKSFRNHLELKLGLD